jgi:hypothetical protein
MSPHTTIPARAAAITAAAAHRARTALARAALALGVLAVAAAGTVAATASPAAAAPAVLYAAPAAAGTGDCSTTANACTLTTALGQVAPGGTIQLVTPGSTAHYVGNWSVGTTGTTATARVTIEAAPGLASQPVLDGNNGASTGCSTAACDGPVLTVPANEYVALTGITIANGDNTAGSFPVGGGLENAGTVTITGSTFTGNTATWDGGAIDNADGANTMGGSVTVTASTFTGNTARVGGAIASGAWGGFGTVTVTASTFTGNTTTIGGGNGLGGYGGAIAIGYAGNGSATVTASTFSGNTAEAAGGAIASGGNGGGATMTVAGDLFNGSCSQGGGTWTDGGYNAGTDTSCFASTPQTGDTSGSAVGSDLQTGLTGNGGPTQTIKPTTGNPAIALIPNPTTLTQGSSKVALCPALDQRGYASAPRAKCDAGAVQTTGIPYAPVTGLKVTPRYTSLTATWKASSSATNYHITVTRHNGSVIKGSATVTGTSARIGHLTPKTTYAVKVLAQPAPPGQKATVVYTTTK